MPMYRTRYVVEGVPPIPLDMLRYDQSFPATEQDAGRAGLSVYEHDGTPVRVTLDHHHTEKSWRGPTPDRWDSFLWRVVDLGSTEKIG